MIFLVVDLIVERQSEDVVFYIETIVDWFQHERLIERMRWVIVCLELTNYHNNHSAIKCRLTVGRRDDVLNSFERQTLKFFHDGRTTHHLLTFKRQ